MLEVDADRRKGGVSKRSRVEFADVLPSEEVANRRASDGGMRTGPNGDWKRNDNDKQTLIDEEDALVVVSNDRSDNGGDVDE